MYILFSCVSLLSIEGELWAEGAVENIKRDIEVLQTKVKGVREEKERISGRAELLSQEIKRLKEEARSQENLLLEIRVEAALKELRDLLLHLKELQQMEETFRKDIITKKIALRASLEQEIERLLQRAEGEFKKGKEKEADLLYKEALGFMEEYQTLSTDEPSPLERAPLPTLDIPLTGRESPEKLRELATLFSHDVEVINREKAQLMQELGRLQGGHTLRKNLLRFQGITEREDPASPVTREKAEEELKVLEGKITQIGQQIDSYQKVAEKAQEKARMLQELAKEKQKEILGEKRKADGTKR